MAPCWVAVPGPCLGGVGRGVCLKQSPQMRALEAESGGFRADGAEALQGVQAGS